MHVRPAIPNDIPSLTASVTAAFATYYFLGFLCPGRNSNPSSDASWWVSTITQRISHPSLVVLSAVSDIGEVIGLAGMVVLDA
jgi:hypothetical protein